MNRTEIVEKIESLKSELRIILSEGKQSNNTRLTYDRIQRWLDRSSRILSQLISPSEADKLRESKPRVFSMGNPWRNIGDEINSYESHLTALLEEIRANPEFVLSETESIDSQTISTPSDLAKLEKICRRFHQVVRQLRNRHNSRTTLEIEDEYDVQDLFHALLKIDFEDIRPEEWTPSYAGKNSRTDFLLKEEKVVIEIKKTRNGLADKEIGDQLIIDIERYQEHPNCNLLICFVYDPEGRIGNPRGIINDLESRQRELELKVLIEPS